jgi:hypothetical protein
MVEEGGRFPQQVLAGRGQSHETRGPVEQLHAEVGLQARDGRRKRRLRDAEASGGAPEMEVASDLEEVPEAAKVHLGGHQCRISPGSIGFRYRCTLIDRLDGDAPERV